MNHLLRSNAPISETGWSLLDDEARDRLSASLAGRRLVDFRGPLGWEHSSTNLGRSTPRADGFGEGVSARERAVLPLVELRADFDVSRAELEDADRGAPDPDLASLDAAALRIAAAENSAILAGREGGVEGITARTTHPRPALGEPRHFPSALATAVESLLSSGVSGPYGLALGPEQYRGAIGSAEPGGYPLIEHIRSIVGGPVVWAPGIVGGVLASMRGGDFIMECGQDLSIGYASHDDAVVRLYLQESFSFQVATPEAAVVLDP